MRKIDEIIEYDFDFIDNSEVDDSSHEDGEPIEAKCNQVEIESHNSEIEP